MGAMTSQIASLNIVYSTVFSGADQRKHHSSASLAFVRGIHQWPVNSSHKWLVARKMFLFEDVIMIDYPPSYSSLFSRLFPAFITHTKTYHLPALWEQLFLTYSIKYIYILNCIRITDSTEIFILLPVMWWWYCVKYSPLLSYYIILWRCYKLG